MTTLDAASELRQETVRALESMGIPVEYVHHEVGPSQHEIDMRFAPALDMADHTVTYRLIVKEIAKKAGFHATFMPKPLFGENGSGMHTHQSLFSDGRNAFFDEADDWHLSGTRQGLHRGAVASRTRDLGGLRPVGELVQAARPRLRGARLRRVVAAEPLGADPDSPVQAGLGAGDPRGDPLSRSGLQPVPHLRDAAARGLEGIEQGYELPEPMETNLYHLTPEQRRERGIVSLPETLGEAIDELAGSELARKALGPHIFDRYVELKRKEWDEYRVQLSAWELERYLPVL